MQNVLILGNGFDLAHGLPTSYASIMNALTNISKSSDDTIGFTELFEGASTYTINQLNEFYDLEDVRFDISQLRDMTDNGWFRYFSKHMEIETWIDFETEIGNALLAVNKLHENMDRALNGLSHVKNELYDNEGEANTEHSIFIKESFALKLLYLGILLEKENGKLSISDQFCKKATLRLPPLHAARILLGGGISTQTEHNWVSEFNSADSLAYLSDQLDQFIQLFNLYFSNVIFKLYDSVRAGAEFQLPKTIFSNGRINNEPHIDNVSFSRVISFNYTQTFERFYSKLLEKSHFGNGFVEYVHGKSEVGSKHSSIVLGVSEIHDNHKQHKMFEFTKYYQKLFKSTDYDFLSSWLQDKTHSLNNQYVNFYVWGHSLDVSDEDYMICPRIDGHLLT